jgi:hypothetical protein
MSPDRKELARIKKVVLDATDGRPNLSEFLSRITGLHPDLDEAIEGIYCGADGRVTEPIGDWKRNICFGWHSTGGRKHAVEWAYVS